MYQESELKKIISKMRTGDPGLALKGRLGPKIEIFTSWSHFRAYINKDVLGYLKNASK